MTALNPAYTIGNQLMEVHRQHTGSTCAAAGGRAVELLEKVGITSAGERLGQYPHQLSGGIQRVMIAMALMCDRRRAEDRAARRAHLGARRVRPVTDAESPDRSAPRPEADVGVTTSVSHDPDGHVHTQRIALPPEGVKVVLVVAFPLPAV